MPLVFPVPPISTSSAHGITFLLVSSYVGSLYLSKQARLSFSSKSPRTTNGTPREKQSTERWRDDPEVIMARIFAVTTATLLCCAGVFGLLWHLIGRTADVGTFFLLLLCTLESYERLTFGIWFTEYRTCSRNGCVAPRF